MGKILKIIFSKNTSSKNLPEALRLAGKLGGVHEDDLVRIQLSTKEVFDLWEWVSSLLHAIDKWRGFEIYYKGRLCMVNKEYRRLFYALQDIRQCYHNHDDPPDYEKCNPGWGCDYVSYISLGINSPGVKKWYTYGHLVEPDTWVIDKNKILAEVQIEIGRKHLTVCPAFPATRIQKVIDQLPDSFTLDEFWSVDYKNEMIDGKLTKVVNSIWYNSEFEKEWFSMEKLLADINKPIRCPYKQGSDQWLDWMISNGYFKK